MKELEIKQIYSKGNKFRFMIKGIDTVFINSIRRTIMNDVPILAIEDVSIYDNSSTVSDEFIAHRLALLPIKTDLKTYKKNESISMSLNKEGPCTAYSGDIKCTDPKIEVAQKRIPIVELGKGQKLKMEMKAVMGTGEEHSKWQPALASFKQVVHLEVGEECNLCQLCIKACPQECLEKGKNGIVLKKPIECSLCGACKEACEKEQLELKYSEDSFVFELESFGMLSNEEIMLAAIEALQEKVEEFKKLSSKM